MNSWPTTVYPKVPLAIAPLQIFTTDQQKIISLEKRARYQIYVCGITPYDATHLGHAATYLTFDILIRYLRAQGAEVNYIQNITDIDDPLLERAKRDKVNWKDLALSQIDLFRSDMTALRILPPSHYEGAVNAIPDVVHAIKKLAEHNAVYALDHDIYFPISATTDFGFESKLSRAQMLKIFAERGGDPTREGKRDPLDALLWLSRRPDEPSWPSEFGEGRPGWHIECAAIALKFAENTDSDYVLDIQGGGSDLIFPHHEMSAAQTKVLTGKNLAKAFVHAGLIGLDGEKMSKSKGNLVFVSKLLEEGVSPMAIRWALLQRHYREDYMWQRDETQIAQSELNNLISKLNQDEIPATDHLIEKIYACVGEDLNTPAAIKEINDWVNSKGSGGKRDELVAVLDGLLGIQLS